MLVSKKKNQPFKVSLKNKDHHEMGLQTSYRQKKTTIQPHFSRPESWYHSFPQIMQSYHQKHPFFKNKKKLLNSRAKNNTPKFARQDPRGGGGLDAGAHESPPKIELETKIRGGNK